MPSKTGSSARAAGLSSAGFRHALLPHWLAPPFCADVVAQFSSTFPMEDASIRALKRAGWRDGSRNERSLLDAFQPAPVIVPGKCNVSCPLGTEIIVVVNVILKHAPGDG